MKDVSGKVVEKIKTLILCLINFLPKIDYVIMWKKNCRSRQATDDNIAHANLHAEYLTL